MFCVDWAELICESWDWWNKYLECLGDPASIFGCRRGGKGERRGEGDLIWGGGGGRVKPKVAIGEARVVVVMVGDSSIGVGVDRDACSCGELLSLIGNFTVNIEGVIALGSSCFVAVIFSSHHGWISLSRIWVFVRCHGVEKRGRRVQHLVRRSIEATKEKVTVMRTVVRIIVKLRLSRDCLVDVVVIAVGVLVAIVEVVWGHSEGSDVTIVREDELLQLGFPVGIIVRVEGNTDGTEDEDADMLVNVDSIGLNDDDRVNAALEVEPRVGKMVIPDVDACVVAFVIEGCWAKLVVEARALVEAKVLVVRSDVVGVSKPFLGGVLCAGGPGIPPTALIC